MTHGLYILSIFIHIIAACVWLGGMFFLILAFIPGVKEHPDKVDLIVKVSMKFRTLGIVALVLLLITGIAQLEYRGVQWTMEYFTASTFGKTVALKLLVFTVIVFFSLVHDLYLGNLTIKAWKDDPNNAKTIRLRNISRLLGRVSFILALFAVWLGVVLVRGW